MPRLVRGLVLPALLLIAGLPARGAELLRDRIDAAIAARAGHDPASPPADDAEFLRRLQLDLAGRIPSASEVRAFLDDPASDKRERRIDALLDGPDYPRRMADRFHVMLMERLGDNPAWIKYLRASFEANKPWDRMAREMLAGVSREDATRGAPFFLSKRLEHYGENPVDYPGLTCDVGRLFLGIDLRCAQCHDHIFIGDYKQRDYQGLFAFFQNASLHDASAPSVAEKPLTRKIEYMSVFKKVKQETGPRIPGLDGEIEVPTLAKGDEYLAPPDPKTKTPGLLRFSPLSTLAERLPSAGNRAFTRNIVNRLWFLMIGRGLVHPLDQHHADNPPSHPELLDLLADEFAAHQLDIKWFLRELALSQTYQRSSRLPEGSNDVPADRFLTAIEKRLSAEQLLTSMLEATSAPGKSSEPDPAALRTRFLKAYANPPREPEDEYSPSLHAALFVLNDETVLDLLRPRPGNLVDRLLKIDAPGAVAEELYLSVLSRRPTEDERAEVAEALAGNDAGHRPATLGRLAWALLASTEFSVNH